MASRPPRVWFGSFDGPGRLRVRDDDGQDPSPDRETSTDRPATARPRSKVAQISGLALLMVATSWVVAASVSPWLVPPYLLLMAALLSPSPARREAATATAEGAPGDSDFPSDSTGRFPSTSSSARAGAIEGDSGETATATIPSKGRRGKGRARKGRPTLLEPAEATWVEVAPGKFVRSEPASRSTVDGPHGDVAGPPDPSITTPTHLEAAADDEGSTLVRPSTEGALEAPQIGLGRELASSSELEPIERDEHARPEPRAQAVDGNTPRAEGDRGGSWTAQPGDGPESEDDDRAWTPREAPGPTEIRARPEAPPEPADDRPTEAVEGPEPPEAHVIATTAEGESGPESAPDGPIIGQDPGVDDATSDDPPIEEDDQVPSIFGLSRRIPRSTVRATPPGRVGRSVVRNRRPPDPRRINRRGLGRPRRVARDHPPRSPPSMRRRPAMSR